MRKTFLFIFLVSLTIWLAGCGSDSKHITPTPTPSVTSNFVYISALTGGDTVASVRSHFDLKNSRGVHNFARKLHYNRAARPAMTTMPGTDSIVMMKNDGTGALTVFNQAGVFGAVQLSLDGKKGVGMVEDLNGWWQIFYLDLSNLSNLNPVQLTTSLEDHYYPQLSPDGNTVLFMKYASSMETGQAFTIPVSGGTETMISSAGIYVNYPTYTPDGKHIVFEEEDNDTIDIMNADGTGVTTLTNQDHLYYDEYPSVSADGKTIVFSRYASDESTGEDVYAMNIDGTNVRQLTTDGMSWDPMFVNDKIVYVSYRDLANGGQIYAMKADGTAQTRITNDSNDDYFLW